jgi:predicted HTH domain antitoxin
MSMTVRQLNIRIPLETMVEIEEIARQEDLGKTDVAWRLLNEGIKHWKLEHALELYREGRISKARAAEIAGVSIYEMMDLVRERSIPLQYSLEEAMEDIKTMLERAGEQGIFHTCNCSGQRSSAS